MPGRARCSTDRTKRSAIRFGTAATIFRLRGARFLGAAIAFYALFSAAPLVIIVLFVVGGAVGRTRTEGTLFSGLERWLLPEGVAWLQSVTDKLEALEGRSGLIGAELLLCASARLFRALKQALNLLLGIDAASVTANQPRVRRYLVQYGSALGLMVLVAVFVARQVALKRRSRSSPASGAAPSTRCSASAIGASRSC